MGSTKETNQLTINMEVRVKYPEKEVLQKGLRVLKWFTKYVKKCSCTVINTLFINNVIIYKKRNDRDILFYFNTKQIVDIKISVVLLTASPTKHL